jgi:tetratricopeptide (TPR) repeat protein
MKLMHTSFNPDNLNQIDFAIHFLTHISTEPDIIDKKISNATAEKIYSTGLTAAVARELKRCIDEELFVAYLNESQISDNAADMLKHKLHEDVITSNVPNAVTDEAATLDEFYKSLYKQYALLVAHCAEKKRAPRKEKHPERSISSMQIAFSNVSPWDKAFWRKKKQVWFIKCIAAAICAIILALASGIARAEHISIIEVFRRFFISEATPVENTSEPKPPSESPDKSNESWPTPYDGMEPIEQTGDPLTIEAYDTENILLLTAKSMYTEVIDGNLAIEVVDEYINALVEQLVRVDVEIDDVTGNRDFENSVAAAKRIVEEDPDYVEMKVHIGSIGQWPVTDEDAHVAVIKHAPEKSLEILSKAIEYYEAALSISAQPGVMERAADAYLVRGQFYYIRGMNNEAFQDYGRAIILTHERIKLMDFDESGVAIRHRSNFARLLGNLGLIYFRLALTDNGSVMLESYVLSSRFFKLSADYYSDNPALMAQNYYYAAMMNHRIVYQKHKQRQSRNFIIEALKLYKKATEYESTPTLIQSLHNVLSYAKAYNYNYPDSNIDLSAYTEAADGK